MNYLSVLLQATLAGRLVPLFQPTSPTVDPLQTNDDDNRDQLHTSLKREFGIFPRLNESYQAKPHSFPRQQINRNNN
jgi:hypothetical protein